MVKRVVITQALFSSPGLEPMAEWFSQSVGPRVPSPGRIDAEEVRRAKAVVAAVYAVASRADRSELRRDIIAMQRAGLIDKRAGMALQHAQASAAVLGKDSSLQPALVRLLAGVDERSSFAPSCARIPHFGASSDAVFSCLANQMNWGEERLLCQQLETTATLVIDAGPSEADVRDRSAMRDGLLALAALLRRRKAGGNALLEIDSALDRYTGAFGMGNARLPAPLVAELFKELKQGLVDREPHRLSHAHVAAFLSRFEHLDYAVKGPYALSEDIARFLADLAPKKPYGRR
ncbi:MAG: hypothetical protein IT381_25355 [Deltaproteobacteria bacterium]|nr:hypothetical protein [Deltaproteobacteria bacterium]